MPHFPIMSTIEKNFEVSLLFREFRRQGLVITISNANKEKVLPHSSLSVLLQNSTPFTETKLLVHCSDTSLDNEMETREAFKSAPLTFNNGSKSSQKNLST